MGAARRRRGRLPRRVYWVRRAVVVMVPVVAVAAVVGVAQLVGTDGDVAAPERARPAGGTPTTAPMVYGPTAAPAIGRKKLGEAAPAVSTGDCDPRDITALPQLEDPEAGGAVRITVSLAGTQPACDFEVGPESLAVKVTDADGRDFWRSQDCPESVPEQEVVVRSAEPTQVAVRWSGRSSDGGCGDFSAWAMPGFYDAMSSVQGSQPAQLRFELLLPSATYVTKTPKPKPEPTAEPTREQTPGQESSPAAPDASPDE